MEEDDDLPSSNENNLIEEEKYEDLEQHTEQKAGGLGDLETGSEKIMSEMLGFDLDDQDECDMTTEEDLIFLKDPSDGIDLIVIIHFFM
jgi:hypothetical protein